MRKKCPVCNGLGKVPKSYPPDTAMAYCGLDGERWPHEICQNCNGEKTLSHRTLLFLGLSQIGTVLKLYHTSMVFVKSAVMVQ